MARSAFLCKVTVDKEKVDSPTNDTQFFPSNEKKNDQIHDSAKAKVEISNFIAGIKYIAYYSKVY